MKNGFINGKLLQTLGCPFPGLAPVRGEGSTYNICMLKTWCQENQLKVDLLTSQLELRLLVLVETTMVGLAQE